MRRVRRRLSWAEVGAPRIVWRLRDYDALLTVAVQSKTATKVSVTKVCKATRLLTGVYKVEHGAPIIELTGKLVTEKTAQLSCDESKANMTAVLAELAANQTRAYNVKKSSYPKPSEKDLQAFRDAQAATYSAGDNDCSIVSIV